MSFLRKLKIDPPSAGRLAAEELGELLTPYPAIVDHLVATEFPGSPPEPRETSTLLIFAEEGLWKAMLRDRDTEATLWATGETPEGALAVLEGLLRLDVAPWHVKKGGRGTRQKR